MCLIRIEHRVPDFDGWKRAFDNDPLDRKKSGVRRFQVFRSIDEPNYVMIDLELAELDDARALLSRLEAMWTRVEGTVMSGARARIVEQVEDVTV